MRSAIALLLVLAVGIGGCDRQSGAPEQANADAGADAGANAAGPPAAGQADRSHKGEAMPDAAFQGADGKPVTLAAFKGKPVLVNVWATWCAPCVRELPTLDALAARAGAVRVVAVSEDMDGATKVTPFLAARRLTHLRVYLDPELRLSTALGSNLPITILYDATGHELWRLTGGYDWTGAAAGALLGEAR